MTDPAITFQVRHCKRTVCIASSSGKHFFVYITATELSISAVAPLIASTVFNITELCLKWVGRLEWESGRWPCCLSNQKSQTCSSTATHKNSAVFSYLRGKPVSASFYAFQLKTGPFRINNVPSRKWLNRMQLIHLSQHGRNTKLNCNSDTQRVELVRKRNILAQQEVFFPFSRGLPRMAEGKWTGCNVSLHWVQTTFLDCFRSKRLNKCEVAESHRSQHDAVPQLEWWQLSLLIWHIMETLCLFFIQPILWSSRTNKSWEWHAASAHEEGFSSWRTQGACVCKQKNELLQEHKKQICCWSHAAVSGVQLAAEGRHSQQRYNSPALFPCAGLMFSLGGKKGKQHSQ